MVDLFIQIRIVDIIDVVLVALLLYGLYRLLKGTAAISIFVGIVAIFLIWQLVNALQMELLSSILGAFVSVGFISLIIIFQPEIRQDSNWRKQVLPHLQAQDPPHRTRHRRHLPSLQVNVRHQTGCAHRHYTAEHPGRHRHDGRHHRG